MNFPLSNYLVVNTDKIKPVIYKKYGDKCLCYPIISDDDGERWICRFKKGFKLAPHSHKGRYEWIVFSGKYFFGNPDTGEGCILKKGDYYVNPAGVRHEEECLEDGEILWIYNKKRD